MPEMNVRVRWPDGTEQDCYSPSLVMHDHLEVGGTYTVAEFTRRAALALGIASDRVRERFGFACTSAAATTSAIRSAAGRYRPDDPVQVLAMSPSLPAGAP